MTDRELTEQLSEVISRIFQQDMTAPMDGWANSYGVFSEYSESKNKSQNIKEEKQMEMFNGMFGKIAPGMCRLSMNGGIAVKTSNGYKTYDLKSNKLTNCTNFVFDIGEDFFFVIPTSKVKAGDIIIAAGKPKCVVAVDKGTIRVINYEDSAVQDILPERHVFMGNTYFYGKIVSMFGKNLGGGKSGANKIMSYMLMSEMMKGGAGAGNFGGSNMGGLLPLMLMGNSGISDMFSGMFDFDAENDDADGETEVEE